MKKFSSIFIIILLLFSCDKEKMQVENEKNVLEKSSYKNAIYKGNFVQDLIVTDKSGENSMLFKIHAENKEQIEYFLNNHDLSIQVSSSGIMNNKIKEVQNHKSKAKPTNHQENIVNETKLLNSPANNKNSHIMIEKVSSNMKAPTDFASLIVKPIPKSNLGGQLVKPLLNVTYTTNGDFIGITKLDWGLLNIYTKFSHRYYDGGFFSWLDFSETVSQSNYYAYHTMPSPQGNWTALILSIYNTNINVLYRITYSLSDFRGRSCTDMPNTTYDGANCYYGIAPDSTTAFYYPDAQGSFYYTPVNGNQCPMSGSFFDGANCFVVDIPSDCIGFVIDNKWYVEADLIF